MACAYPKNRQIPIHQTLGINTGYKSMFKNYDTGLKRNFSELISLMLVGTALYYGFGLRQ